MTTVSDFVQVQLSPAGVAFAGPGGSVRVTNGRFDYTFAQGTPVRVLVSEWRKVLSLRSHQGAAIFEAVAAPSVVRTISPVSSHSDAPEQKAEAEVK
jgi:hypothetical protein